MTTEPNYTQQPISLDGLTIDSDAWGELTYIFQLLDGRDPQIDDADGEPSLSRLLSLALREWCDMQGPARLQKLRDAEFFAECQAEGEAKAATVTRRVRKARRAAKALPVNVTRIDVDPRYRPVRNG